MSKRMFSASFESDGVEIELTACIKRGGSSSSPTVTEIPDVPSCMQVVPVGSASPLEEDSNGSPLAIDGATCVRVPEILNKTVLEPCPDLFSDFYNLRNMYRRLDGKVHGPLEPMHLFSAIPVNMAGQGRHDCSIDSLSYVGAVRTLRDIFMLYCLRRECTDRLREEENIEGFEGSDESWEKTAPRFIKYLDGVCWTMLVGPNRMIVLGTSR